MEIELASIRSAESGDTAAEVRRQVEQHLNIRAARTLADRRCLGSVGVLKPRPRVRVVAPVERPAPTVGPLASCRDMLAMSGFALMRDLHWAEILSERVGLVRKPPRLREGIFLFDCHIGSARSREFVWTLLSCEMSRRS